MIVRRKHLKPEIFRVFSLNQTKKYKKMLEILYFPLSHSFICSQMTFINELC